MAHRDVFNIVPNAEEGGHRDPAHQAVPAGTGEGTAQQSRADGGEQPQPPVPPRAPRPPPHAPAGVYTRGRSDPTEGITLAPHPSGNTVNGAPPQTSSPLPSPSPGVITVIPVAPVSRDGENSHDTNELQQTNSVSNTTSSQFNQFAYTDAGARHANDGAANVASVNGAILTGTSNDRINLELSSDRVFKKNPLAGRATEFVSSDDSGPDDDDDDDDDHRIGNQVDSKTALKSTAVRAMEEDTYLSEQRDDSEFDEVQRRDLNSDSKSSTISDSSLTMSDDGKEPACCRLSSLVVVSVLMCIGTVIVGLLGFLPFYFVGVKANGATTEFLLSEAMKGVSSITQNSVSMLPAFVHIIAFNYIKSQNTTASQVTLPDDPEQLLLSLLTVLTRFYPTIQFLRFVYTDNLYTDAAYVYNSNMSVGAFSKTPTEVYEYQVNQDTVTLDKTKPHGMVDFAAEMARSNGAMQQIVQPWSRNNAITQRWLFDSTNVTSIYFDYVLPLSIDGKLGYCEAGLPASNIIDETYRLIPALREHGRVVILDAERNIVLQNSWGQNPVREVKDAVLGTYYEPLLITSITDPIMQAAVQEVERSGGFNAVMGHSNSALVRFPYNGKQAHLNLTRLTDNYGLNILLGATVLRADFEKAFVTAQTVVIAVTVGVVVIAAVVAVFIAYVVVKPLKKLVPELQRASALEISVDTASSSDGDGGTDRTKGKNSATFITEIRHIQEAYRRLKESLKEMKTYVPQAVLTNVDDTDGNGKADGKLGESGGESGGVVGTAQKRDTRLNTRIFKEQVNESKKKLCTLVLLEMHSSSDVMTVRRVLDIVTSCVREFGGCMEQLGHDHLLVSFGAHAPLPMHTSKGSDFALRVYSLLQEPVRNCTALLVDSAEFMVGTCGAKNRNSRVVFGFAHMMEALKVLYDIDLHVACTKNTATHLASNRTIPVENVRLKGVAVPLVLCELCEVSSKGDGEQQDAYTKACRDAFQCMSSGDYSGAFAAYSELPKRGPQQERLLDLCKKRMDDGDKSPYERSAEDVYHFENQPPPGSAWVGSGVMGDTQTVLDEDVASTKVITSHGQEDAAKKGGKRGKPGVGSEVSSPAAPELSPITGQLLRADSVGSRPVSSSSKGSGGDALFDLCAPSSTDEDASANDLGAGQTDCPLHFQCSDGRCWTRSVKSISSGAFSIVYLGMSEEGMQVAIKCIPRLRKDIDEAALEAEIDTMAKLLHQNIVRYIGYSVTQSHLAIIMEYVPGGSLRSVIDNFGALDITVARRFMVDIVAGLAYLHSQHVVHCDVKPHNILLGVDGACKLTDFGSALTDATDAGRDTEDGNMATRGTALYMAPEVAKGGPCTEKSDVFSLGISLLEMVLGRLPWRWTAEAAKTHSAEDLRAAMRSDARFLQMMVREEVEPDVPSTLSGEVTQFVGACCSANPDDRPTIGKLASYAFLM